MAKYGKKASDKVEKAMHERKRGQLRSGRSGRKVTSREQAIAIGLSEARREGGKVPSRRGTKKSGSTSRRRGASQRTGATKRSRTAKRSGTANRSGMSRRTSAARRSAKKR